MTDIAAIAAIEAALPLLDEARGDIGGKIAWLAVRAIALRARAADPEISVIRLFWDEDGDHAFMSPLTYHAAGGADLAGAALDQLTEAIRPACTYLDETNTGAWQGVTTELDFDGEHLLGDGDKHLYVSLALSLDGPARPGTGLALPRLPDLDARHRPQPHPCAGDWEYAGRNRGGHEVFSCTGGHRLIAPHPAQDRHTCAAACGVPHIAAPSA